MEVSNVPRNKYPEETIQKILDVSYKLFLEKGYEKTTIMEIVDNLGGLTKGAFYHHFKSKEEVLCALNNKLFEDDPLERIKEDKGLNGLQKLRKALFIQANPNDKQDLSLYIATLSLLNSPRFLMEHMKTIQNYSAVAFQPFIEEGIADGSIKNSNPKILTDLMLLLLNVWFLPTIYPCSKHYMIDKVMCIKDILEYKGLPLFDSETMENIINLIEVMDLE
jgi:AcrR family transcriptional regulator